MSDKSVEAFSLKMRRWQIRVKSHAPTEINSREFIDRQNLSDVMERLVEQVARASYNVEGPNSEVMWSVELWEDEQWRTVVQGKSRVNDRPIPNRRPYEGGIYPRELG